MSSGCIPFRPPEECIPGLLNGTFTRWGPLIRDVASGRWVRLLQETGLTQDLVQTTLTPGVGGAGGYAGLILSGGHLFSSIAANVQLEQVKAMLSTLQLLTGATMATAVVGVGVSAVGFALVLRRLEQVERSLAGINQEAVAARLLAEKLDVRLRTRDWARTQSLLHRGEEAWGRSDAESVWRQIEGPLYEEQLYWRGLIEGKVGPSLFCDPRFSLPEAILAYESALTLASSRVQTLLLLEELPAACRHAQEFQEWHERVVSGLKSIDLARARSRQEADRRGLAEDDAYARLLREGRDFMEGVHEIQSHLDQRPTVLQQLRERGVSGREYVAALRERTDVPFVMVPLA
jgi:hypothetical protein